MWEFVARLLAPLRRLPLGSPSPMLVFCFVLVFYFLIMSGVIYDIVVEPPSIGMRSDPSGKARPVAFLTGRVSGPVLWRS